MLITNISLLKFKMRYHLKNLRLLLKMLSFSLLKVIMKQMLILLNNIIVGQQQEKISVYYNLNFLEIRYFFYIIIIGYFDIYC